jgi:hypothetical protein
MKKFGQYINESDISFDSTFRTQVKDISIYFLFEMLAVQKGWTKEEHYDMFEHDEYMADVTWILEPEMRNDCIKSMNLTIKKVVCNIEWWIEEGKEETIEIDTTLPEFNEWQLVSSVDFQKDGGVCPTAVQFDFRSKKIFVD